MIDQNTVDIADNIYKMKFKNYGLTYYLEKGI